MDQTDRMDRGMDEQEEVVVEVVEHSSVFMDELLPDHLPQQCPDEQEELGEQDHLMDEVVEVADEHQWWMIEPPERIQFQPHDEPDELVELERLS